MIDIEFRCRPASNMQIVFAEGREVGSITQIENHLGDPEHILEISNETYQFYNYEIALATAIKTICKKHGLS